MTNLYTQAYSKIARGYFASGFLKNHGIKAIQVASPIDENWLDAFKYARDLHRSNLGHPFGGAKSHAEKINTSYS